MSDLLMVHNWDGMLKQAKIPPRIMEVPVDPKSAPFLVSAREGAPFPLVWVHKANNREKIRACPRKDLTLRAKIIEEVVRAGEEKEVGNVHPLTAEGVQAAMAYLKSYSFDDVEALVASDVKETYLEGVNTYVKEWVPSGHLVLVPADRSYVGDMGQMSTGHVVVVVHNPLRGIAVVKR